MISQCSFYDSNFYYGYSVKSKRGVAIKSLYLESSTSMWDLQQDLGVLAQQALPLELR